jgi:IS605 OrfB family transposase
MIRTASIRLDVTEEQSRALADVREAYTAACNSLVPVVRDRRVWNRVELHKLAYASLRETTPLPSQLCCNAIFSVCKAYKAQKELGRIPKKDKGEVPQIRFGRTSVHYDKRTYTIKSDSVSLTTLGGRITALLKPGDHQRRILESGMAKEAELVFKKGEWFFNLVVESDDPELTASGSVMGVDVGENNLAAHSLGKVFGGEKLREECDRHLALRRRLQSNGSQSAMQKLRQVTGKERRHMTQINHEISKAIVKDAVDAGIGVIALEDLTHICDRIKAKKRVRTRLHRWAWRQLQSFVEYKALAAGIEVRYVNPAYTSQTCAHCGGLGKRSKHRFVCEKCGLRAHADLNASRNLARIGETAVSPRAAVNTPDVGNVDMGNHVSALQ